MSLRVLQHDQVFWSQDNGDVDSGGHHVEGNEPNDPAKHHWGSSTLPTSTLCQCQCPQPTCTQTQTPAGGTTTTDTYGSSTSTESSESTRASDGTNASPRLIFAGATGTARSLSFSFVGTFTGGVPTITVGPSRSSVPSGIVYPRRRNLSGGAIAGIVIGSVTALAILLGALFFLRRRRRARRSSTSQDGPFYHEIETDQQTLAAGKAPNEPGNDDDGVLFQDPGASHDSTPAIGEDGTNQQTLAAEKASNQTGNDDDGVLLQDPVASHDTLAHGNSSPPKAPSKLEANQTENPFLD